MDSQPPQRRGDPDSGRSRPDGSGLKPFVRVAVPVLLAALTVAGLWLVFTGGDDGPRPKGDGSDLDGSDTGGAGGTGATGAAGSGRGERLPIDETDAESVSEMAGLQLPASTGDFMSARLDDDSQLDVSFTISPEDVASFIEGSGLPEPEPDERVITHASPLWNMNVDGTIRGASDTAGGVARSVELVDEDGRTRVRLVITPAG